MKIVSLFFAIAAALCLAPQARATDNPKACAAIKKDADRLECFDLIFKKTIISSPANDTKYKGNGSWDVYIEKSKIDDTENVRLRLRSDKKHQTRFRREEFIELNILCRENKTDMYVNFGSSFMSDTLGAGKVTYRIDARKARKRQFTGSTDHSSLGLWGGGNAIPFVKQLFGARKLLIRAVPYSENAITADFSITGIENAIKPLRKACHW